MVTGPSAGARLQHGEAHKNRAQPAHPDTLARKAVGARVVPRRDADHLREAGGAARLSAAVREAGKERWLLPARLLNTQRERERWNAAASPPPLRG